MWILKSDNVWILKSVWFESQDLHRNMPWVLVMIKLLGCIKFASLFSKKRGNGKNEPKATRKTQFWAVNIEQSATVLLWVIIEVKYYNLESPLVQNLILPNVEKCIKKLWTISFRAANTTLFWAELLVSGHKTHSFYKYLKKSFLKVLNINFNTEVKKFSWSKMGYV